MISGQSHSVAMLLQDVTERRSWEVAQRRLVGELNHRVKNMLTIVQSIASQTQKSTADPEQFNVAFAKRLRALGEVHDILTVQGWVGADLEEMTKKALGSLVGVGDPRVRIKGPAVHLSPNATIAMSMVIHELATNAIKYGSLSDPSGKVQITWEAKDDRSGKSKVYMSWIESGGPKVERPTSSGFGMRLLTEALAYELDGVAHLDFKDTGLVCRIEFSSGDDVAGQ